MQPRPNQHRLSKDWPLASSAVTRINELRESLVKAYRPDVLYRFLIQCLMQQSEIQISKLDASRIDLVAACNSYNRLLADLKAHLEAFPEYPQGDFVTSSSALAAFGGFYDEFYADAIEALDGDRTDILRTRIADLCKQMAWLSSRFDQSYETLSENVSMLKGTESQFRSLRERIVALAFDADRAARTWFEKLEGKSREVNEKRQQAVRDVAHLAQDKPSVRKFLLYVGYLGGDGTDSLQPLRRVEVCSAAPDVDGMEETYINEVARVLDEKCRIYAQMDARSPELAQLLELIGDFEVLASYVSSVAELIVEGMQSYAAIQAQTEVIRNLLARIDDRLDAESKAALRLYLDRTKDAWKGAIEDVVSLSENIVKQKMQEVRLKDGVPLNGHTYSTAAHHTRQRLVAEAEAAVLPRDERYSKFDS